MKKLRKFRDWPFKQVEEVARMLYPRAPFEVSNRKKVEWNALTKKAFDFLDNLHEAYEEIAERRKKQGECYAIVNALRAEADKLPDIVPFDKAVRFITRNKATGRAKRNFETFVNFNARRKPVPLMRRNDDPVFRNKWAGLLRKLPSKKKRQLAAQLEIWRKDGIPRDRATNLQSLFDAEWPLVKDELNKMKRAKRSDERRGGKRPKAERRLQPALMAVAEWGKKSGSV